MSDSQTPANTDLQNRKVPHEVRGAEDVSESTVEEQTREIIETIESSFQSGSAEDLHFADTSPVIATEIVRKFTRSSNNADSRPFKYSFNPDTKNLTIRGMPMQAHNTLAAFFGLGNWKWKLRNSTVFTYQELLNITPWRGAVVLPGSAKRAAWNRSMSKLGARRKLPDFALVYKKAKPTPPGFPHVVFEVGYSQKYSEETSISEDTERSNINEWLGASGGRVKMVVLVKIEESGIGNVDNEDSDEDEAHLSPGSLSDGTIAQTMKKIGGDVDKLVGKLTVFIETWSYSSSASLDEGKIVQQGPRQYLMKDNILSDPMPTLPLLRELFELENHPNLPNTVHINLEEFAQDLLLNRRETKRSFERRQ